MSSILNISSVVLLLGSKNQYTYTRVKNLFNGIKGNTKKSDIQLLRKVLKKQFDLIDAGLAKLENHEKPVR